VLSTYDPISGRLVARLAASAPPPAIEMIPAAVLNIPCDATASGVEAAQVELAKDAFVLSLCGHHFAQHELALAASGWRVTHDIRSH
jgi:hypothetical protein